MKTETVSIKDLKPDPKNARKHPDPNLNAIKLSLETYGQRKPIVVNKRTGCIEAGNGLYLAACALGWSELDVVYVDDDKETAAAYGLMDNKSALMADWDLPNLKDILTELDTGAFDMDVTGFSTDEIEELMNQTFEPQAGLTDDDAIPEKVETICKKGDLWKLGNHRLLCGDSTVITDVERLMGGEKADICFTSPPYSNLRDYHVGEFNWDDLMIGVWDCVILNSSPNAHILVNLGVVYRDRKVNYYWQKWLDHAEKCGYPVFGWYIWDKGFGMCGDANGRLAPCHEFLFHFNKVPNEANKWVETHTPPKGKTSHRFRQKDGSLKEETSPDKIGQPFKIPDSVIRITKETNNQTDHPAPFPVEFAEFGLNTWSFENGICYEPFSGSGTTIIACEKLGRRCYGIDIDPHYCDIAIKRWEDFTGKKAELVNGT